MTHQKHDWIMTLPPCQTASNMEKMLALKLQSGDAKAFATWLTKQPTRQLLKMLRNSRIIATNARPSSDVPFPHVFAVIQLLSEIGSGTDGVFESIIKTYLQAGCDLNEISLDLSPSTRARKGFTPLLLAIDQRKVIMARVLVQLGANVNVRDASGYSPLHWAAFSTSNVELVQCLLKNGAKIEDNSYVERSIPPVLHVAVDEGRVEIVNYLLEFGVNVNTSAVYAVLAEKYWCKLTSRYDCGIMDCYLTNLKITALGRAVRMRKLDVLSILLRNPESIVSLDDLHYCVLEGDCQTANMIMTKIDKRILACDKINGTQIWTLHQLGDRAFQFAHTEETTKLIKTYVDHGFDVNTTCDVRQSSESECVETTLLLITINTAPTNLQLIENLLKLGADPFIPLKPTSVFRAATLMSDIEPVQLFLPKGIDICNRLREFESLLTMQVQDKLRLLEYVKSFVPPVKLELRHLFLSMLGSNEFLVDFVLENISEDNSLFCTERYKHFNVGVYDGAPVNVPLLEDFIEKVIRTSPELTYTNGSLHAIVKIVAGFLLRGYELRENIDNSKILTVIVVHAVLNLPSLRDQGSIYLFNELMLVPQINWTPATDRSLRQPLNNIISHISRCTRCTRICFSKIAGEQFPLWSQDDENKDDNDGGAWGHIMMNNTPLLHMPCFAVELPNAFERGIQMLEALLDKGVCASHINLTNVLKNHPCLIRHLSVVKKLWWAGAHVNFVEVAALYESSSLGGLAKEEFLGEFKEWIQRGQRSNWSLRRITAVSIRNSFKYHNMDGLHCAVIPPKKIKQLIRQPNFISECEPNWN